MFKAGSMMLAALLVPATLCAQVDTVAPDWMPDYRQAMADYYQFPIEEVQALTDAGVADDGLAVVLSIASQAKVAPELVAADRGKLPLG